MGESSAWLAALWAHAGRLANTTTAIASDQESWFRVLICSLLVQAYTDVRARQEQSCCG